MGSSARVFLLTRDCGASHTGPAVAVAYGKTDRTTLLGDLLPIEDVY